MRQGAKPLRKGSKLDSGPILAAAFDVLDAEGLDGLSLRLVAERLEVQTPALYWHVKNKAALISLMAATFAEQAKRSKDQQHYWSDKLLAFARALRRAMLLHRDSARLCLAAHPLEKPEVLAQQMAAPLIECGLSARQALSYHAAVIAYTVGWVAYEQSQAMHDFLAQMIDFSDSFETGLLALVSGLKQQTEGRLNKKTTKPGSVRADR
jgi:TetR/AcrR family tetracycline transcriptional repressor